LISGSFTGFTGFCFCFPLAIFSLAGFFTGSCCVVASSGFTGSGSSTIASTGA